MPMEYLWDLAQDELPLMESDMATIDKLRLLYAAGLVEARLPLVYAVLQTAHVLYITGLGCAALRLRDGIDARGACLCHAECDLEPSSD